MNEERGQSGRMFFRADPAPHQGRTPQDSPGDVGPLVYLDHAVVRERVARGETDMDDLDELATRALGPDWERIDRDEAERRFDELLAPVWDDPELYGP